MIKLNRHNVAPLMLMFETLYFIGLIDKDEQHEITLKISDRYYLSREIV